MKKVFYNIIGIGLILAIILANIFIGTPIKYNISLVNTILSILMIVLIINEKKIKFNKIDFGIIIIVFSTFISIFSNKYLRLKDTVYYIFQYISILNSYFIIRILVNYDKKFVKWILKTIIIMSVLLVIFGIDGLTSNFLYKIYDLFQSTVVYNESKFRMSSLFKYPNAFAVMEAFSIFLTLGMYLESKFQDKEIYGMAICVQLFGIIASSSRMVFAFLAVGLLIFFIINKKNIKPIFNIIFLSGINAVIFYILFFLLKTSVNFWGLCFILLLINIEEFFVLKYLNKKEKSLIILLIIILLMFVMILINVFVSNDIKLFNKNNVETAYRRQNIKVKSNTEYCFKINLNVISQTDGEFSIVISEVDKNEKNVKKTRCNIEKNFKGTKEIKINSQQNTNTMSISFLCKNPNENIELEVKDVYINDKKIKMNYGIIPIELINRIERINLNSGSMKIRYDYFKAGIEIIKTNVFFGYGGNAWNYYEKDIILDTVAEHNYLIQLWIQFGIFAPIAFITLMILIIIRFYKYCKKKNTNWIIIGILFAVILLLLHSLLDFDMSFFSILLMFYMCIAILNTEVSENTKEYDVKILKVIYIVILVGFLYLNLGKIIAHNIKIDNMSDKEKLKVTNLKIALAPFEYDYRKDKINIISTLKNTGYYEFGTEDFNNACREIIKQEEFIVNKEKYKFEYYYLTMIYNKIDLITEENQDEILDEIESLLINIKSKRLYESIKLRLTRRLDNAKSVEFINEVLYIDK